MRICISVWEILHGSLQDDFHGNSHGSSSGDDWRSSLNVTSGAFRKIPQGKKKISETYYT